MTQQDAGALSMQVWVAHVHGRAVECLLEWPTHSNLVTLSTLLQAAGLELDEDAAHCRFHLISTHGSGLGFEHSCNQLVCSINGVRTMKNELTWLQAGDVIEIGLMRLQVRSAGQAKTEQAHWTHNESTFDLRELAPRQDLEAQPHSIQNLIQGVESEEVTTPDVWADGDELGLWNQQYLRRLKSPMGSLDDGRWSVTKRAEQSARDDPMDELINKAHAGPVLTEILGQSDHISTVLAQLGDGADSALTQPVQFENVMHFFAPRDWVASADAKQLPSLTRKEHHGMALDSAFDIPSSKLKHHHE